MPVSSVPEPSAPHRLDLVIDFVNTLDLETGVDELAGDGAVSAWLVEHGLLDDTVPPLGDEDRNQAVRLREALRSLMLTHNGGAVDTAAASELEQVAERGAVSVVFAADGSSRLSARGEGISGALGSLLVPIVEAGADGTWERVKACRAEDCHWAFYDRSRNRAGVWCDMAVCGNRTKVRAYRRRKPAARGRD